MNHPTLFPTEAELAATQPRLCWVCSNVVQDKPDGCDRACMGRSSNG
jgi:hypothetical protein